MIECTDLRDPNYGFHLAERHSLDHFDSTSEDFHFDLRALDNSTAFSDRIDYHARKIRRKFLYRTV